MTRGAMDFALSTNRRFSPDANARRSGISETTVERNSGLSSTPWLQPAGPAYERSEEPFQRSLAGYASQTFEERLNLRMPNFRRIIRIALAAICFGFVGSIGSAGLLGALAFPGSFEWRVAAQSPANIGHEDSEGTLSELTDKRRVALLIMRNSVVDASGSDEPIIAEALAAEARESLRHRYPYRIIGRKLNGYIRKYRSLQPVYEIGQADFIIYFRLVQYRRTLNGVYPFGELFVIINQLPGEIRPARIIWRTKRPGFAEDVIKDFIKELKRVRDEG